mmetsp:Transcript_39886/g.102003  ORF Transcript_39886/g.102003 Transcript_39886/m.102003 type:complete len:213 (-) Transcript_39886:347-985(-)
MGACDCRHEEQGDCHHHPHQVQLQGIRRQVQRRHWLYPLHEDGSDQAARGGFPGCRGQAQGASGHSSECEDCRGGYLRGSPDLLRAGRQERGGDEVAQPRRHHGRRGQQRHRLRRLCEPQGPRWAAEWRHRHGAQVGAFLGDGHRHVVRGKAQAGGEGEGAVCGQGHGPHCTLDTAVHGGPSPGQPGLHDPSLRGRGQHGLAGQRRDAGRAG